MKEEPASRFLRRMMPRAHGSDTEFPNFLWVPSEKRVPKGKNDWRNDFVEHDLFTLKISFLLFIR